MAKEVGTLFRLKRRFQYAKYCFQSLTQNVFHEPTTDLILEQLLVPIGKLAEKYLTRIAVLFILLVHAMVLCIAYIFLIEFDNFWSIWKKLFGSYLLLQILFNYNLACFTSPGFVTDAHSELHFMVPIKKCTKCQVPKPPRAHHCSSCKKCVLLMDHHCPWIHNCVGFFNRRYFFNFCFFTTCALYFVAISLFPYFLSLKQHYNGSSSPWYWFPETHIAQNMTQQIEKRTDLVFCFCCLVILPLSFLTYYHIYLISTGQTTIERLRNRKVGERSEFDLGFWRNWMRFYSIRNSRDLIFHIIFPSLHSPTYSTLNYEIV